MFKNRNKRLISVLIVMEKVFQTVLKIVSILNESFLPRFNKLHNLILILLSPQKPKLSKIIEPYNGLRAIRKHRLRKEEVFSYIASIAFSILDTVQN